MLVTGSAANQIRHLFPTSLIADLLCPNRDNITIPKTITAVTAAGAATPNSTWLPGGVDDALQLKGGGEKEQEQDRGQEDDEEEEEFDGGEVSGIRASEGIAVKEADHDDDLGGVVMLHDEMVAANRRQELPEASQRSSIAVDITVRFQHLFWSRGRGERRGE